MIYNPLVSIYIPTSNRVKLLKKAVESVLMQSYKNIEILIVNDCSIDETQNYLQELSLKESRVKFFTNSVRRGASYSRNLAINNANGEFITGLDDDDFFLEDRILNFVNYWRFKKTTSIALYSKQYVKDKRTKLKVIKRPKTVSKKQLFTSNFIGNQIFTRTNYIRNIHGFDEELPAWEDLDCWLSLLNNGIAERTNAIDYVIDTNHTYERISNNIQNIETAFIKIVNKHKPNKKEKNRLYMQLLKCKKEIKITHEILKSINALDVRSIFKIIKINVQRKIKNLIS